MVALASVGSEMGQARDSLSVEHFSYAGPTGRGEEMSTASTRTGWRTRSPARSAIVCHVVRAGCIHTGQRIPKLLSRPGQRLARTRAQGSGTGLAATFVATTLHASYGMQSTCPG